MLQSPDLNPIENMWFELKRTVHKCKPKDMKDLERFCMEEWSKIPPNVFSKHIKHYRIRLCRYPCQGEAAPSTKNRGANNCETFFKRNVSFEKCVILVDSIESLIKLSILHNLSE